MGIRFEASFLDEIRSKVDLVDLIGREVQLKRAGQTFAACCPFHEEKTPSFNVSPTRNTYRCWGCGASGNAIDWMRKRHHMTFPEAVEHLASVCGLPLPKAPQDTPEDAARRKHLAELYQALRTAARAFSRGLDRSTAGRAYLETTRGLSAETIARYDLGVVEKGVVGFMESTVGRAALIASGLAAERADGSLYDRFRYRVMFPIHNEAGTLIGFAGRSMLEKPDKTPKYLNSPETELFHKGRELYGLHLAKQAIRASGVGVVVEGYFDVIGLGQAGEDRAVAPMGTAMTGTQIRRLLAHADTIVFAFDGDAAGTKAALSAATVLLEEMRDGKAAKFLFLPEGKDPDEFVRAYGIDAWRDALNTGMPLSTFLVGHVTQGMDRSLVESQVAAVARARELLARIQHAETFRRALELKLSEAIGLAV
ncbi:DNA primase [Ralstonia holmesii]|uniref:DNA primase n=1 Tax=Ralstonia TaxID=48736 RepID=UPI00056C48C8|nr:DNA primase [Ralstonia pickettii]